MTLRRILWPDGGFVLYDHVWRVLPPRGWLTCEKRPVFPVIKQPYIAVLYADREHTQLLGTAERGARL